MKWSLHPDREGGDMATVEIYATDLNDAARKELNEWLKDNNYDVFPIATFDVNLDDDDEINTEVQDDSDQALKLRNMIRAALVKDHRFTEGRGCMINHIDNCAPDYYKCVVYNDFPNGKKWLIVFDYGTNTIISMQREFRDAMTFIDGGLLAGKLEGDGIVYEVFMNDTEFSTNINLLGRMLGQSFSELSVSEKIARMDDPIVKKKINEIASKFHYLIRENLFHNRDKSRSIVTGKVCLKSMIVECAMGKDHKTLQEFEDKFKMMIQLTNDEFLKIVQ